MKAVLGQQHLIFVRAEKDGLNADEEEPDRNASKR